MSQPISINPVQLREYLRRSGWEELGSGALGETWATAEQAGAPAILVPLHGGPDVPELMWTAVRRLSSVTGLEEDEVLDRILATSDALEVRLVDPTTRLGRIPLERGAQLVDTLRQLLHAGARLNFLGGRAGYRGDLPAAAREVLAQLELAPPAQGSFKLEVYAPAQVQLTLGPEPPPNPIHDTLVATLRAVEIARETAERDVLPDDADELEAAVKQGLSTNLLDAIIRLDTRSSALRVEFTGRWSQQEPQDVRKVTLEARHFAQLPAVRDVLAQKDPREDFALRGWIKAVAADELALGEHPLSGVATVESRIEGGVRDVRVELAGDALREARSGIGEQFLSAMGTLEKIGRDWRLTSPRGVLIRSPQAGAPEIAE
jgi:hypothetical protein